MEEGFLTSKPEVELMISNAIVVDGNMSYTWNGQPVTVSEMDSFRKEMDSFDPRPFLELTITDDLNLSQKKEVLKTISVIFQCSKEYDCYFYAAP
ncbi:hypothetical protein GCM10009096_15710 [Parasphingorhabdus litoris]|uniref:Uncharacterized protein n=2 Tax=Parasphingorhabdus litoris TaxID=394733 RepID=A0ABN1AF80_9SPHN|nr:hypothetical protein [Parasphingorhabdus litoris]